MYIIQVKQNPNVENYIDMAEEKEAPAAKQRMKQLVGEYQSEGRIVEVKAEAKMQYNDYFDKEQVEKVPEEKIATPENQENEVAQVNFTKEAIKAQQELREQVKDEARPPYLPSQEEINEEAKKMSKEHLSDAQTNNIIWAKAPCKGEICSHFEDGECESFADIHDPILNSEGECNGFDSKYKTDSEELKDLPDDAKEIIDVMLDQAMLRGETPTLSQVVDQGIKRHEVYKYFNGYKEACKIAGLEANSGGRK